MSCYQLQMLDLVYMHNWMSLLLKPITQTFIVWCVREKNLLAFYAEVLVELVSFSMMY